MRQVTVCLDVDSVVLKLVTIKSHFPTVDVLKVVTQRPRLLLLPLAKLEEDVTNVSPP